MLDMTMFNAMPDKQRLEMLGKAVHDLGLRINFLVLQNGEMRQRIDELEARVPKS